MTPCAIAVLNEHSNEPVPESQNETVRKDSAKSKEKVAPSAEDVREEWATSQSTVIHEKIAKIREKSHVASASAEVKELDQKMVEKGKGRGKRQKAGAKDYRIDIAENLREEQGIVAKDKIQQEEEKILSVDAHLVAKGSPSPVLPCKSSESLGTRASGKEYESRFDAEPGVRRTRRTESVSNPNVTKSNRRGRPRMANADERLEENVDIDPKTHTAQREEHLRDEKSIQYSPDTKPAALNISQKASTKTMISNGTEGALHDVDSVIKISIEPKVRSQKRRGAITDLLDVKECYESNTDSATILHKAQRYEQIEPTPANKSEDESHEVNKDLNKPLNSSKSIKPKRKSRPPKKTDESALSETKQPDDADHNTKQKPEHYRKPKDKDAASTKRPVRKCYRFDEEKCQSPPETEKQETSNTSTQPMQKPQPLQKPLEARGKGARRSQKAPPQIESHDQAGLPDPTPICSSQDQASTPEPSHKPENATTAAVPARTKKSKTTRPVLEATTTEPPQKPPSPTEDPIPEAHAPGRPTKHPARPEEGSERPSRRGRIEAARSRQPLSARTDNVRAASTRLCGVVKPNRRGARVSEYDSENDGADLGAIMSLVSVRVPESLARKGGKDDARWKFRF